MTEHGARGRASQPRSPGAHERVTVHHHAGELLRARSVLVVSCTMWLVCGASLDLGTHGAIGSGSLAFVLAVRFATTLFHVAIIARLFRAPLPGPRAASALVAIAFPVSSFALMLIATHMGGLASPYVTGVFVIVMGQTITWPAPWRRGAVLAAASALVYPLGLLAATRFDDGLRAQLYDRHAVSMFAVYVAVIGAGSIIAVWGGHAMWSLRQSVFESRKLGRYRLLKRIGQGGMGEVWCAEDRAMGRNVALKILARESGRKPALVARFEREIHATAKVSHPNVVRIHDWGITDDGVWYYAMDLLAGTDLATLVKRCGPLPPALALQLFVPVAGGLAEAHRHGIVHRDIKPANMFVVALDQEAVRIELLDFGIAQIGDDAELTQAGAVLGTPGFMAPEVLAGAPGGIAADLYGLGASLYFALTGTTPRETNHAPASSLVGGIEMALDDALVRALDAEPSRRFAAADEFAGALAAAGLVWAGSWRIDRDHSVPPGPATDPTIDPEAPPTQVEAPRANRV